MGIGHASLVTAGPMFVFHETFTPASGAATRISAIMPILWASRIHRGFVGIQVPLRGNADCWGSSNSYRLGEHRAIPHGLGRVHPVVVVMTPPGEWEACLIATGPMIVLAIPC